MDDLKARFSIEAAELIEKLEQQLLGIENHGQTTEAVGEIFRIIHTIKGTAAMFGFSNMGLLTHDTEDLYDEIRNGKLAFNKEILNLSFKIVDLLNNLLQNNDKLNDAAGKQMTQIIEEVINRVQKADEEASHADLKKQEITAQEKIYYIRYQPDEDVLSRGIEPLSVFEELAEEGQILAFLDLSKVPSITDYDTDLFFLAWDIFFYTSAETEMVEDVFMFFLSHEFSIEHFEIGNTIQQPFFKDTIKRLKPYGITENNLQKSLNILCGECLDKQQLEIVNDYSQNTLPTTSQPETKELDTIRIDSNKLDELINLVSDLVTLNGQLELKADTLKDTQLEKQISELSKLTKRFRDNALNMRLVQVSILTTKMQRLVRDLSLELQKKVDFITEGINTELDKSIINRLEGPIMHIIRNCLDHAIETPEERLAANKPETGIIRFIAFHSGGNVFIQIQDDGRGIDVEKIRRKAIEKGMINSETQLSTGELMNILFEPGFSTAESVSNISGRGVGLDTVKKQIADMRGQVDIESELGLGTSFTIKLPLTLSIIDTLETKVDGHNVLIPMEFIIKTTMINDGNVRHIDFNKEIIPVLHLHTLLNKETKNKKMKAVIIQHYDKQYAISVDKIEKAHQAVVKPLGAFNRHHPFFSGSSIMGDGSLALILDINRLIKHQKHENS